MTVEEKILSNFLNHPDKYFLATEIAALVSAPESHVKQALEHWKRHGFEFIIHPQLGYSLAHTPDMLNAQEIAARLPGNPFAQHLLVLPSVDSTNTHAMKIAPGAPEGTSVAAEVQTAGRGRHGRTWISSQSHGIYLSCIFKPDWIFEHTSRLVIIVSVAACRAIEKTTPLQIALKWPNDLLFKNAKIGGILTEARIQGSKLAFAVAGIGLNINHRPEDFPGDIRSKSTSLSIATGQNFRRGDVLAHLLKEIHSTYLAPFHDTLSEWKNRCVSIGKYIQVHENSKIYSGVMSGLDEEGSLLLRLDDGRIRTIRSGEILFY